MGHGHSPTGWVSVSSGLNGVGTCIDLCFGGLRMRGVGCDM